MNITKHWYKILAALLVLYTIYAGLMCPIPALPILHETIRNLYYHVPMWFAMISIFGVSVFYSIKYLSSNNLNDDVYAVKSVNTGMLFGTLGLLTGMMWANYTWGTPWTNDPKLNGAAISMLMYMAYLILRGSIDDADKKARISAIYNIFSFPLMIVLLFVLPRLTDSLHPGNGGNPGFSKYDLDNGMRMVFYPAVLGWILMAVWIMTITVRIEKIKTKDSK